MKGSAIETGTSALGSSSGNFCARLGCDDARLGHLSCRRPASEFVVAHLAVNPRESYVMAKKGTALAGMMQAEFVDKCPNPQMIPPNLRLCYRQLAEMNAATFKAAEALGWQPTS